MRRVAALLLLALSGCGGSGGGDKAAVVPPDLETAAIERGLIRDPGDSDITGLYARDTDRLCIVKRAGGYRIGASIDYGEGLSCTGSGNVARAGSTLSIELKGRSRARCVFDAWFDGERVTFPANLPDECARLCGPRASFAALDVERLSQSAAEAEALRAADGTRPCGD